MDISLKRGKRWNAMAGVYDPLVADLSNFGTWEAAGPSCKNAQHPCGRRDWQNLHHLRAAKTAWGAWPRVWCRCAKRGAPILINAVDTVPPVPKIGTCFSHASPYLSPRRVLFLASDGNIPVALSKSEGAGSVVARFCHWRPPEIRSSGMRLPDGCYGPATHFTICK